jgi:predicted DNA-binding protein with PD1-like motif
MRSFFSGSLGRLLVLAFERGEDLLEKTIQQINEAHIKNGVLISGIGTFDRARLHRVTSFNEKPDEDFITIEAPMELSSVQGIIADGVPHFHFVFSDLERTYTGHLENGCRVLYLAELVIAEITDMNLEREMAGHVKLLKHKS